MARLAEPGKTEESWVEVERVRDVTVVAPPQEASTARDVRCDSPKARGVLLAALAAAWLAAGPMCDDGTG